MGIEYTYRAELRNDAGTMASEGITVVKRSIPGFF